MGSDQKYLFSDKRFLPLFLTQFFGCLSDNILKNALITMITYESVTLFGFGGQLLALIANGLFILPFIVFAGISGQIADKYERVYLIRIIKLVELFIVALAIHGFHSDNLLILLICIGLMGIHSTFFGPLKYSVLPDHLKKEELLGANGFIDAGTFLSILIGTLFGGIYEKNVTEVFVSSLMVLSSIVGIISAFFMPKSNNSTPELEINSNFLKENINIIKYAYTKKQVFLSILGISWFWFIGATVMSQIPFLAKDILGADRTVVNLFLAIFSIGVSIGSLFCNKLLENEITTKYIVTASIGISIFGIDLFFGSSKSAVEAGTELIDYSVFLLKLQNWRIMVDLFFISALGGFYIVPLYAAMQYFSSPTHRSRVIAANNIINSGFMILSTCLITLLLKAGLSIPSVILFISLVNLVVAIYIFNLVSEVEIIPIPILKWIFKFFFDRLYNVQVKGLENYYLAGNKTVIVANHISYLDPPLIAVYLPGKVTFAINTEIAKMWWVKPLLKAVRTYPIDPNNAMSAKALISEVKKGKKIAIFPEGRISVTGTLMKVYEGPGMIADKAGASILPIRIDGPQFTPFSKVKGLFSSKLFPQVTITILPPVTFDVPEGLDNRDRRKYISLKLYDIMSDMIYESSDYEKTIFQSFIEASKTYGAKKIIVRDIDSNNFSYRALLMRSFLLAKAFEKITYESEVVGFMLPNSSGSVAVFMGMQAKGLVPSIINFTAGINNIIYSCKTTNVRSIFTSKRFIEAASLQELAAELTKEFNIIYLEDLRNDISIKDKLKAIVGSYFPEMYYKNIITSIVAFNDPAVILFTSGTEGKPKSVVLSHKNIQANRCQVSARINFNSHDLIFNALPIFHSFGLTVCTILPLLSGIQSFQYPSPLHFRVIPEIIYDIGATIIVGTDTFLNGYAKFAHPYDFYSVKYVFAGAEKLRSETRKLWFDKYGLRILEGYGATEASPAVAFNTNMHDRYGTVGRFIPGIKYFIKPVAGIEEGGELCISGNNIMLGYINPDNPGKIIAPHVEGLGAGWYATGDIAVIDSEGFINIKGRVKRFAKIAGEMVSLLAVEEFVYSVFKEGMHAVICISDDKRGEQIILFTTNESVTREDLVVGLKEHGMRELFLPRKIIFLKDLPVFSTGKVNYAELNEQIKLHLSISENDENQDNLPE